MANDIIASGDALPIPLTGEARQFMSSGERLNRRAGAPDIASCCFNTSAPSSSLTALGTARADGAVGIIETVIEITQEPHVCRALEAARDAVEEVTLILQELQQREHNLARGGVQ